eukprot:scaffold910_cov396-Prasinococcus_capsulatus_cf.AAC.54
MTTQKFRPSSALVRPTGTSCQCAYKLAPHLVAMAEGLVTPLPPWKALCGGSPTKICGADNLSYSNKPTCVDHGRGEWGGLSACSYHGLARAHVVALPDRHAVEGFAVAWHSCARQPARRSALPPQSANFVCAGLSQGDANTSSLWLTHLLVLADVALRVSVGHGATGRGERSPSTSSAGLSIVCSPTCGGSSGRQAPSRPPASAGAPSPPQPRGHAAHASEAQPPPRRRAEVSARPPLARESPRRRAAPLCRA